MPPTAPDEERLSRARHLLAEARSVVVLTGSGVSAESRIPTFRESQHALADADEDDHDSMHALWEEFDPQTLATPEAFEADPENVSRWYDWRRLKCLHAEPNPGHTALAELQRRALEHAHQFTIVTQNIDGLHQRAGATGVIELHGTIMEWRGVRSGRPFKLPDGPMHVYPPEFENGEPARPGVVWFGEMLPPNAITAALDASATCDLFLSVGTSSVVYPAAGLIHNAREAGAATIEINPDVTPITGLVDIPLRGKSGEVLPMLV